METSSRKRPVDPSATAGGMPKQLRLGREAETPGAHYDPMVTQAHADFSSSQGTSDRRHLPGFLSEALVRQLTSPQEERLEHDRTLAEHQQQTRLQPHFQLHVPKRSASSRSSTSTASTAPPPSTPVSIKANTQGIDLQAPGRNAKQVINDLVQSGPELFHVGPLP